MNSRTVSEANHLHGACFVCLKCDSHTLMFDSQFFTMLCLTCGTFVDLEAVASDA